jgi:hypothetical protein
LDREITDAFGSVDDLIANMKLKVVYKGVTYESLSDPEFQRIGQQEKRLTPILLIDLS